jgi:serine/threonine-protein kinase RsbW
MKKNLIKIDEKIASERKSISLIEPIISQLKKIVKLSDEQFFNILLVATEAANNAIVHGNKENPDKFFDFKISANEDEVKLTVIDQGDGFRPDNIPDPRHPDQLMHEHGRGVFLIRELSDSVQYSMSKTGTKLVVKFLIKK